MAMRRAHSIRRLTLPDKLYSVTVPRIATYTPEEIELFGMPMDIANSSSIYVDQNAMAQVMLPLTKIIDIYNQGYPIRLNNPNDLKELYEFLENFIYNKSPDDGPMSLNGPKVIDGRVMDMDRFASEIFELNRQQIVKENMSIQNGFDTALGLGSIINTTIPNRTMSNQKPIKNLSNHRINTSKALEELTDPMLQQPTFSQPSTPDSLSSYLNTGANVETTYVNRFAPSIDPKKIKRVSPFRKINNDKGIQ